MRISKVGCNYGTSLKRHTQPLTSPIIQSSPTRTRVLYQLLMEDTVPLAGRFLCSFDCQQNIIKKCGGGNGQRTLSALWMYNLLIECKSVASLSTTRKKYEDKMFPTDCHYLLDIAEEMQFPAARCAQGNSVCMYGKSVSSGVEAMKMADEDICQKTAVDILNTTLILLKKESTRYNKQWNLTWNHAQILTPKGMELMEEAFNNVKVQDFKVHLTENENEHAIVSKKSTSQREYSVIIPESDTLGSRFGKCICGFPKKEGTPWQQMVAVSKLGRINGLTRTAIMPHFLHNSTVAQSILQEFLYRHPPDTQIN
jgi:hypothetical protein